jgi:uncharacterized repeat protein (TIGR02543 family)
MKKTLIVLMMVLLAAVLIVSCKNNVDSPVMYKVTFDSDNGSEAVVKEVKDGDTVPEPSNPTKTGYNFVGWYEGETKFEFGTKITKDYSLKAKWTLAVPGDTVNYGTYPNNYAIASLRNQPITWKVLSVDTTNSRMLVISENVLEKHVWNNDYTFSSYEQATVHTYLNNDFYNNYSLSSTDILNVTASGEPGAGSYHLFLLSTSDLSSFGTISKVANYDGAATSWWLRSTITDNITYHAYYVTESGSSNSGSATQQLGLRPAMWLSISK